MRNETFFHATAILSLLPLTRDMTPREAMGVQRRGDCYRCRVDAFNSNDILLSPCPFIFKTRYVLTLTVTTCTAAYQLAPAGPLASDSLI